MRLRGIDVDIARARIASLQLELERAREHLEDAEMSCKSDRVYGLHILMKQVKQSRRLIEYTPGVAVFIARPLYDSPTVTIAIPVDDGPSFRSSSDIAPSVPMRKEQYEARLYQLGNYTCYVYTAD